MKRTYLHKAAMVALVLWLSAPKADAEDQGFAYYRLFYLFDPDSSEQLLRALDLERATHEVEGVELFGVVDSNDIGSPWLNRLDSPILSIGDFLRQDQSAADALEDWVGSGDLGILLVKQTNGGTTTVAGDDFEATIQGLFAAPSISTEVDVTTWGKVKDLFN